MLAKTAIQLIPNNQHTNWKIYKPMIKILKTMPTNMLNSKQLKDWHGKWYVHFLEARSMGKNYRSYVSKNQGA